jgi:phage gp36-like protein
MIAAYLTREGLTQYVPNDKLALLTDDDNGAVIDEALVTKVLADTTSTMNSYLRNRYVLPLVQSCSDLDQWAGAIARHVLYARRPDGKDDLPPTIVRTYKEALRALEHVRDCSLSLDVIDSSTATNGRQQQDADGSKSAMRGPRKKMGGKGGLLALYGNDHDHRR